MKSIPLKAVLFGVLSINTPFAVSGEGPAATSDIGAASLLLTAQASQYHLALLTLNGAASSSVLRYAMSSAIRSSFALTGTGPWTESYEYDAAGRLKKVTFADGAITNYALDNAGNRTNVTTTVP